MSLVNTYQHGVPLVFFKLVGHCSATCSRNPANETSSWFGLWLNSKNCSARAIHPTRSSPSNLRKLIQVFEKNCSRYFGVQNIPQNCSITPLAQTAYTSSSTLMMVLDSWSYLWFMPKISCLISSRACDCLSEISLSSSSSMSVSFAHLWLSLACHFPRDHKDSNTSC